MVTFNWETYTPYSIGFDETFRRLESIAGAGSSYPPYNVVDGNDGTTILEIALAGFTNEDIEVSTERHVLNVAASKTQEEKERKYQHKGISQKAFSRNWQLAEDVEVQSVDFKDGLLTITLKKELPEKEKRKTWF